MADLLIGTSAFTAAGWDTAFYPRGMKPADYLTYYATKFDTVEIDSTFYRTPSLQTVRGWDAKTPGFRLCEQPSRNVKMVTYPLFSFFIRLQMEYDWGRYRTCP
jgi:hypothetical protein